MQVDLDRGIQARYHAVLERIARAARSGGRRPEEVRLVVVSKTHPVETIRAAYAAGARRFGENYAEQALPKMDALSDLAGVEWHMIGHVQSRKTRLVAARFDFVHSLDSLKLAERLEREAADVGRRLPVLLEINLAGEASKAGWQLPEGQGWQALLPEFTAIAAMPHLQVRGLMAMPPLAEEPEAARPYFRRLARLRDDLAGQVSGATWDELSMGTSADFAVAVQEGATLVRIGQAILGPRPRPNQSRI